MRFATRTFLLSFVPAALLLLACFAGVQRLAESIVRDGLHASLKQSQRALQAMHEKNAARNQRVLEVVGDTATLMAGLELWHAEAGSPAARLTLEDQLGQICATLACDFLMASDPKMQPLAGVLRSSGRLTPMDHVLAPQQGFFVAGRDVFHVTSAPINREDENLGVLSLGERFDFDNFATATVLTRSGKVLRSAFPKVAPGEMETALAACGRRTECEVRLAGETYLALSAEGSNIGEGYRLYSLQSVDAAMVPVQATLRKVFLMVSVCGLLATLALSALSSRSMVKPIASLVAHLRRSESTGKLCEFQELSSIHEIRELNASFNRAASAIQESREKLARAYTAFIETLAQALDARDAYTAGHSKRVSDYSCAIARALNLGAENLEELRVGALLHDIGKIGIPDEVLQKPGRLTAEEFRLIQQHPEIGRRILEGLNDFERYLSTVELHHENWDGTGYPKGMRGEEVPLNARIVHVADAFDAMTSDRPYRHGMSVERALRILQENAGTQFDPAIAGVFCALIEDSERLRLENDGSESSLAALATSLRLTAV